jgi:hypothetical protein
MSLLTDARQKGLSAIIEVSQSELATGVAVVALDLPQGATIVGGYVIIDTAFDSVTSDSIDVGFTTPNDTDDPNAYTASPADGQALGATALTVTGREALAEEQITITNTAVGTEGTAGQARVVIEYVEAGRHDENYGDGVEFAGAPA